MTQQLKSQRTWRVTVLEWLAHIAIIEADTAELAEADARPRPTADPAVTELRQMPWAARVISTHA